MLSDIQPKYSVSSSFPDSIHPQLHFRIHDDLDEAALELGGRWRRDVEGAVDTVGGDTSSNTNTSSISDGDTPQTATVHTPNSSSQSPSSTQSTQSPSSSTQKPPSTTTTNKPTTNPLSNVTVDMVNIYYFVTSPGFPKTCCTSLDILVESFIGHFMFSSVILNWRFSMSKDFGWHFVWLSKSLLSDLCNLHDGLISISVCLSGCLSKEEMGYLNTIQWKNSRFYLMQPIC